MEHKLEELKARLREIYDLEAIAALLDWDQNTYMPAGGVAARMRQIATLRRLIHEKATDVGLGRLLDALRPYEESLPYDSDEASLIRVARRDYERATKVPADFMAQLSAHASASFQAWTEARPAGDFARVQPYLEKTLDLSRQLAEFFPGYEHIADPLIDLQDYGLRTATVRAIFERLREQLLPIVKAVAARPPVDDSCLYQSFPEQQQLAFTVEVVRRLGYDFTRGRQDKSPHPFTTSFSTGDVRITIRVMENALTAALFSSIHEAGHAMYDQGIDTELEGTPLATGASSSVHESQSRLWENIVGRSKSFWSFFYPRLQELFPEQLGDVSLETFYRAINKVKPSPIRIAADELSYNLHILMRFDLELQMLEGRLSVHELPEAWNARMEEDLGITPASDKDGVLQDVHWYGGMIGGMFHGYALGNILSAQFFDAALRAHPEIIEEMESGHFATLLGWLRENIYRHGRKYTTSELVERITGEGLNIEPYIRYLRKKYGELYGIANF
ncbi:MAG: carboxypeptidase M32 [Anaerolineae bacterium]|nr:carboxypeptidase M32 [Anaerolineae bacterium]